MREGSHTFNLEPAFTVALCSHPLGWGDMSKPVQRGSLMLDKRTKRNAVLAAVFGILLVILIKVGEWKQGH